MVWTSHGAVYKFEVGIKAVALQTFSTDPEDCPGRTERSLILLYSGPEMVILALNWKDRRSP